MNSKELVNKLNQVRFEKVYHNDLIVAFNILNNSIKRNKYLIQCTVVKDQQQHYLDDMSNYLIISLLIKMNKANMIDDALDIAAGKPTTKFYEKKELQAT